MDNYWTGALSLKSNEVLKSRIVLSESAAANLDYDRPIGGMLLGQVRLTLCTPS